MQSYNWQRRRISTSRMNESLIIETSQCDSLLGSWTQTHWIPASDDPLAGAVERIWDFEGSLTHRREQLFPNGLLELVIQLDEPHRSVDRDAREPFPAICLDGLHTVTSTIEGPRGRFRVLGIRLRPLGAFALIGVSLAELTDRSVDLCAVLGRPASDLGQRLEQQRQGAARVRTAVHWLRARLARARGVDPLVAAVLGRIERDGGRVSIAQLDEVGGRSRSRLAQRFREQVGLAPKRYARVVRFRRALELLGTGVSGASVGSLSTIALAAGYYDQAHMNAEFREHAGLPPRRYRESLHFLGSNHLAHADVADELGGSFFQDA